MEIVGPPRERSRIARIFRKLAEAFSKPEPGRVPTRGPRILVTADGSVRSHCGILLVGDTCAVCGVRPSWRDEP